MASKVSFTERNLFVCFLCYCLTAVNLTLFLQTMLSLSGIMWLKQIHEFLPILAGQREGWRAELCEVVQYSEQLQISVWCKRQKRQSSRYGGSLEIIRCHKWTTWFHPVPFCLSLDPKSASNSPLYLEDLISFSFQVARGMEFLASRKVWLLMCSG